MVRVVVRHDSEEGQELTSEECVRAGMYWFGRSDFAAADAWWRRALEIDPTNTRAQECLRLLSKSSSTGIDAVRPPEPVASAVSGATTLPGHPMSQDLNFEPESSSENMAVLTAGDDGEPSAPMAATSIDDLPMMVLEPTGDLRDESSPPDGAQISRDLPLSNGPHGAKFPFYDDPEPEVPTPTDAFDFAATGQSRSTAPSPQAGLPPTYVSPWDDGPSRTSVLTIDADDSEYDAVAEPTPLPAIDRVRFFSRPELETPKEIMDFLRATGDLPGEPAPADAEPSADVPSEARSAVGPAEDDGLPIDEPVEYSASGAVAVAPQSPAEILKEGQRRYQLHDFAGALELLERLPAEAAEAAEARNLIASSRRQMLKMYESKIGDFDQLPRVLINSEEVIWLNLDHRMGFILSQIDGTVTYEDIISLSGMPRLDTVRILAQLLNDKVIGVE